MRDIGKYLIILLILGIIYLVFRYFGNIVSYILISYVLSLIGIPLVDKLDDIRIKKYRLPKWICAAFTLILMWTLFISFFRFLIPLIANQANEIAQIDVNTVSKSLEEPMIKLEEIVLRLNLTGSKEISIQEYLTSKITGIVNVNFISNFFGFFANLIGNLFIAFLSISFITFFFLKDEKLFSESLMLIIPTKHEEKVRHVLNSIKKLLSRYFIGLLIEIIGMTTLVTLGLTIVGIKFQSAIVIGLLIGLINVIPYLGPLIGGTIGIVIGIVTHLHMDFSTELLPLLGYMLLVFACAQIIDNVVFQPFIYSNSVHAHPLEIFVVIMVAATLAGVMGMLLAIPGYTILRVIAKEFFSNFKIVQRLTKKI